MSKVRLSILRNALTLVGVHGQGDDHIMVEFNHRACKIYVERIMKLSFFGMQRCAGSRTMALNHHFAI